MSILISKDLRIEAWSSTPHSDEGMQVGGGKILKGVLITHLPTKISIGCDTFRTQQYNKIMALEILEKIVEWRFKEDGNS